MQNSTANFDKTSTNLQNGIEVVCSTIVARRSKRDHWKTLGFIFGSSTATIFLFRFPLVRIPVLPSDMMFHKSPVIYFDEWFSFCISSTKSTILSLCCDWTAQTSASVVRQCHFADVADCDKLLLRTILMIVAVLCHLKTILKLSDDFLPPWVSDGWHFEP